MNPRETKFILRAHRSDGRYAPDDPLFADAIAATQRSPELADWLAREHTFDETIANRIEVILPPAGLRETILAGARASRLGHRWWQNPIWLAAAAVATVVGSTVFVMRSRADPTLTSAALTEFALHDVAKDDHEHTAMSAPSLVIAERLTTDARALPAALNLDYDQMRAADCARFQLNGHEVLELCIERDGAWFHLYAVRRTTGMPANTTPTFTERGTLAALTWTTGDTVFTLATNEGPAALRRVT